MNALSKHLHRKKGSLFRACSVEFLISSNGIKLELKKRHESPQAPVIVEPDEEEGKGKEGWEGAAYT